ncbi:hypothetical protein DICPUDRAFT_98108 [Dictyostelium purpureum]|uniref:non-specific serine/threonine protein kinase n=1 Tax=Dictyostelium purpureum TaxID=5786 RepID=F0ZMR3_DICPU|nr:uncharacterized protein DICPUDRAFT_98108 [Dictyostelium purpureum]EGC34792.1 hypothetical protein DICPUDRAFT_98108 [Dictyostelium purpureum]|eukprot:XP_003288707.1 hypothetical protein DICPUDRAFT_98108 [Dictyostelium purpureum]
MSSNYILSPLFEDNEESREIKKNLIEDYIKAVKEEYLKKGDGTIGPPMDKVRAVLDSTPLSILESQQNKKIFSTHYGSLFCTPYLDPINGDYIYNIGLFNFIFLPTLPLACFQKYQSEFRQLQKLGQGGYGSVFLAKTLRDSKEYAIKIVNFRVSSSEPLEIFYDEREVYREVRVLEKLNHKNILKQYSAWCELDTSIGNSTQFGSEEGSMGTNKESTDVYEIDKENTNVSDSSPSIPTGDSNQFGSEEGSMGINKESTDIYNVSSSNENRYSKSSNYNPTFNSKENNNNNQTINPKENNNNDIIINCSMFIQTEYCQGTLNDLMENPEFNLKSKREVLLISYQIIEGVDYLHSEGLMHRDLKPSNIFLNQDIIKIGDFGLAKPINHLSNYKTLPGSRVSFPHTTQIGTKIYASPEQEEEWLLTEYTEKVDIYSCGIILFELLCGHFLTQSERKTSIDNLLMKETLPRSFSEDEKSLIKNMVKKNPSERPSAKEVLTLLENLLKKL